MAAPFATRWSRARALASQAIEPRGDVVGRSARRRARYTALSFVVLLPLGVSALVISLASPDPGTARLDVLAMGVGLGILLLAYPMSRGPRSSLAALAALGTTSLGIWVPWLAGGLADPGTLYFLVLPLTVAGLIVGPLAAAAFSFVHVAAALAFVPAVMARTGESVGTALTAPLLLLFVAGFAVNGARLRQRDLDDVESLAQRLGEQDRARVLMLNNIAHDLASPMTPLKLHLGTVPKDRPLPPERVVAMKRNLGQLERLVTDLKDLARMGTGGFGLRLAPADLGAIVQEARDAFAEDAHARGLTLHASVEGALDANVDAQRVTQVVYNLVTNALKFTPPGGTIHLRARRDEGRVVLLVQDSGRGLDRHEMDRLFQPFSQVHDAGEVKERGTGLGLHISRGLAEAHGGALTVASEGRGRGSTFTLTLPAAAPTAPSA